MRQKLFLSFIAIASILQACAPEQRCYRDEDCDAPMICKSDGSCDFVCRRDADCGSGFVCKEHQCKINQNIDPCADGSCLKPECDKDDDCDGDWVCKDQKCTQPEQPECDNDVDCDGDWVCKDQDCVDPPPSVLVCPEGMSLIQNTYCMDKYEASRPDATESYAGSDNSKAVSVAGVMPWNIGDDNAAAEAACQAAGKRLCTPAEWEFGCHGVNDTVYAYGDTYDPVICNGLDTYGRNNLHLMPTGSFPNCNNGWDVYDLNGNLWEHTAGGSGKTVRGGAFNCVDSEGNHKCSYIPQQWTPLSMGFRCCKSPEKSNEIPQANHIDIRNTNPQQDLYNLYQQSFFSERNVLIAWNDSETDTMTDASQFFAIADNNDIEHEMTVEAAQMIGLKQNEESDVSCVEPELFIANAQELWDNPDTARDAVKVLKDARKCHPDNADISRALGIAYTRSENYPWAIRTLTNVLSENPNDCESGAWLAWTYLQMGMPDEVHKMAKQARCEEKPLAARIQLIESLNALSQNESVKAKSLVQKVYSTPELTKSDKKALSSLQNMAGISRNPNMTWKVELDGGYASNALSGSPNDPRLYDKKTGSPFLDGEVRLMIDPWKDAFSRVIFEGQVNGQYLFAKDAKDYSYIDVSFRPGIVVDWENIKFGTYYRPEFLILKGGDIYDNGPLLNYFSQRVEIDMEIYKWLYIFGGYGHRTFRQRVRTRDEIDIGAGGHHPLGYGLSLTWGATYRHWFSTGDMYDLNGTNVSLALDYRIIDILFRLNSSFAFDDYADSKGYFDSKNARRDYLLKGTLQIWSPALVGIRFGAQFKASRRWSTADDYDYTDYRALLSIRWTGDLDFYAPKTIDDNYTSIPWNLENADSAERIRDIIQQDEDLQRSSSCLQN